MTLDVFLMVFSCVSADYLSCYMRCYSFQWVQWRKGRKNLTEAMAFCV